VTLNKPINPYQLCFQPRHYCSQELHDNLDVIFNVVLKC